MCNLSENIRPQSSPLAEPVWTDPGIKSGSNVRELISASRKRKKEEEEEENAGGVCMVEHSPKIEEEEEETAGGVCMVEHSPKILASEVKPPPD